MKLFGEKVKQSLKELGITQKDFANKLGVQPSTLCEWLNGHNEPPMQTLVDIALALDVSTDYLLGIRDYE